MMNDIFIKLGEVRMNEWISIIAVLMSPLIAVCVTMLLEKRRQRRKDKMELFQVLMTQRGINEMPETIHRTTSQHDVLRHAERPGGFCKALKCFGRIFRYNKCKKSGRHGFG